MANERLVDFRAKGIAARSPTMLRQLRDVAHRHIVTRSALRTAMPEEFVHCPPTDLLFPLFVAPDHTMTITALLDGSPTARHVARRWIDLLVDRDLAALRDDTVVLTESGFRLMAEACQAIIEVQTGVSLLGPN